MGEFATSIERSKAKSVSASGGFAPLIPDQGLCPWTPLGAPPPDPRYRLTLCALAMPPLCQILNTPLSRSTVSWSKSWTCSVFKSCLRLSTLESINDLHSSHHSLNTATIIICLDSHCKSTPTTVHSKNVAHRSNSSHSCHFCYIRLVLIEKTSHN